MAAQFLELELGVDQGVPLPADQPDLHHIANRQIGEDLQVHVEWKKIELHSRIPKMPFKTHSGNCYSNSDLHFCLLLHRCRRKGGLHGALVIFFLPFVLARTGGIASQVSLPQQPLSRR